jgi:polysaccharide pyruvyl transferase CsaB
MNLKNILIIGNYGAGNLGDDAILGGIVTDLRAVGFTGSISVTYGGVRTSTEIYSGLKKVCFAPAGLRSFLKRRKLAHIEKADLVIIGGGGLFVDSESWRAPMIWSAQAKACRKVNTPYIIYGQSIGPLKRRLSRHLCKIALRGATAIHVRDKASFELLKKWKITSTLGSDIAFSWLQNNIIKEKRSKVILVSLRNWGANTEKSWRSLLKPIEEFAKKEKLKPVMLGMDLSNQSELEALRGAGWDMFESPSAKQAAEAYAKAEYCIAMRLHANIFALSASTPLLSLSYSTKVISLLKTLGLSEKIEILKTKTLTPKKITKALIALKKQKPYRFNMEGVIIQNQDFLAHALDAHK